MASPAQPAQGRGKRSKRETATSGGTGVEVVPLLARYREQISHGLRRAIGCGAPTGAEDADTQAQLEAFYGQMEYHFGWRQADLRPDEAYPGKLLRPTLLLLGCELAVGRQGGDIATRAAAVARALPAAIAVEMVHNFSLIHDDIEDGDEERRHRPTLWRVWGEAQAINTGDGLFALARLALLDLLDTGVPPLLVMQLAAQLDRSCLRLCEGQHLDMSFEGRQDVTVAMYLAMIERKTAALMECALGMGARLGGSGEALAAQLGSFGRALGLGFQLRDDLLGIWAPRAVLGKTEAGDLRRRKMSLPVIHALEHAEAADREALLGIYTGEGTVTNGQVANALGVLERTGARQRVREALREQCDRARSLLAEAADDVPAGHEPRDLLATLVDNVAADAR